MKKRFLVLMVFLLCFTTVHFSVSAEESGNLSEQQLDQHLKNQGYPEEVLSKLSLVAKQEFYYSNSKFISVKQVTDNFQESLSTDFGVTSLTNWDAFFLVSQKPYNVPGLVKFTFSYHWDWDLDPLYTLTDKFGIAWTDDFNAVANSAHIYYRPAGFSGVGGGNCNRMVLNDYTYHEYKPGTGIGWEFDIINQFDEGGIPCFTNRHTGHGRVDVIREHDGSGSAKPSSYVATYFHKYGAINGSLTMSKTPSITISPSFNYDKAVDTGDTFIWYQQDFY